VARVQSRDRKGAVPLAHARGSEGRATRQQEPAAQLGRSRRDGTAGQARGGAASKQLLYIGAGVAGLGLLVYIVALALSDKSGTRDLKSEVDGKTETAKTAPETRTPKPDTPPAAAVQPQTTRQQPASVQKTETAAERPWKPIFDGKTLDCLIEKGAGAWRVENGAIVNVLGQDNAALTNMALGDAEVRIRFDGRGTGWAFFSGRGAQVSFGLTQLGAIAGKQQELIFVLRGESASCTVNRQARKPEGTPRKGGLQFNAQGGDLRVFSIEYRELAPPKKAP
jgi:hypothetical protein